MAKSGKALPKIRKKLSPAPIRQEALLGFGVKGAPLNLQHPFYFGFLAATGALVAIALLQALQSASQVFVLIIIALFLAMGLNPAVTMFTNRNLSRGLAVTIVAIAVLAIVALFSALVIPPVLSQVNQLINGLPQLVDSLRNNSSLNNLDQRYNVIESLENNLEEFISDGKFITGAFGGVLGVGRTVLSGAFSILTIMVLTLYFLASLPSVTSLFYRLAPASRRERVSRIGDEIVARIGAFVGSQVVIAALASIYVFFLSLVLNLPYAAALGMLVLVVALIPLVGHFIGGGIVSLIALTVSPVTGILALVLYTSYVQIENYLITPRIMKRSLSIPGLVTIVAALLGASLLGLVGGLLAVPFAAAIMLIMNEIVFPKTDTA
jgi:predicted PurR-regulated permease PerM